MCAPNGADAYACFAGREDGVSKVVLDVSTRPARRGKVSEWRALVSTDAPERASPNRDLRASPIAG